MRKDCQCVCPYSHVYIMSQTSPTDWPNVRFRYMPLEKTYEMEPNPPNAMSWDDYERFLLAEWSSLLQVNPPEKEIQVFLEQHPCMVPGSLGLGMTSGHFPLYMSLFTQPVLQGLTTSIPDFMWLASDSSFVYPVLIEIEAPAKRWFTNKGVPRQEATQAISQIKDWKTWFSVEVNRQWFLEFYGIGYPYKEGKALKPLYLLVHGRRAEFADDPRLSAKRGQLAGENEFFMTYDRLAPSSDADQLMCVRASAAGEIEAVNVPPTFKLGPMFARDREPVREKVRAVQKNQLSSEDRKEFLVRRISYWDEWAKDGGRGPVSPADEE